MLSFQITSTACGSNTYCITKVLLKLHDRQVRAQLAAAEKTDVYIDNQLTAISSPVTLETSSGCSVTVTRKSNSEYEIEIPYLHLELETKSDDKRITLSAKISSYVCCKLTATSKCGACTEDCASLEADVKIPCMTGDPTGSQSRRKRHVDHSDAEIDSVADGAAPNEFVPYVVALSCTVGIAVIIVAIILALKKRRDGGDSGHLLLPGPGGDQ